MSTAIRDHLPSVDEAKAFYNTSNKSLALDNAVADWLNSDDHKQRVWRHFNDMFGSQPWLFIADEAFDLIPYEASNHPDAPSDLTTAGVYYLRSSVKATCGTPVTATAWWTDGTIQICPSAISSAIKFTGGISCTDSSSATGIHNSSCGCGPDQIICYPFDQKAKVMAAVAREFADRGVQAYEQGWSWLKLLGGDTFFGNRWLYHHYLYQQRIVVSDQLPTSDELALLKSLPLDSGQEATFIANGPERGGVVTMPAFMRRFNNFRSRIRALSNQLLCKDVDGTLNTDGYATFINPDLSAFDKAHGTKGSCATCHYGMDNQGSILLGWNDSGFYEAWDPKSQIGHVFGEDGTGPRFLMQSYVERATDFNECMAKTTWEAFSGAQWSDLSDTDQAAFISQASSGPQAAIKAVLTSTVMKQLRAAGAAPNKAASVTYDFTNDINPILTANCSGSGCHSPDNTRSPSSGYVGNASLFKNAPKDRIANGSMPPADSGHTLTADERTMLLIYLNQ